MALKYLRHAVGFVIDTIRLCAAAMGHQFEARKQIIAT